MQITEFKPQKRSKPTLTKEDVWGSRATHNADIKSDGMIVADSRLGGFDEDRLQSKGRCPIFGDHIPWKSVTVVGPADMEHEIEYWLSFVHGAESVSQVADLDDGRVAMRSDYMAW